MAAIWSQRSMPRAETIRGLARGLRVLEALQSSPISTLHEIHRATHISKPSLLRILNTLQDAGFVSRRLADGRYRISAFARVGRKRDRHDRVAEAAAPVLDRLCQNVRWPSDLMVPAGDHMERRETIFGLPERQRGILYAAVALATITIVATRRMWDEGGLGAMLWLAFLGLSIWALYSVWRAYREY